MSCSREGGANRHRCCKVALKDCHLNVIRCNAQFRCDFICHDRFCEVRVYQACADASQDETESR